jgi:hypothetical protein
MARLIDEFLDQLDTRADRGLGGSAGRIMERFGWSTADVAERFGVSARTARRWRQKGVPAARQQDWRNAARDEARRRTRDRIERRGIRSMTVQGTYRISRMRGKTGAASAVRTMPGSKIAPAQMRDVFAQVDAGDLDAADAALNEALAEAYEAPGLSMEDVDSLEWGI